MRIEAAYSSSAQGLYQAQGLQSRAAVELSRAEPRHSEHALVDLKRAEQQAQTSVKAIKSSNDMVGTLIDMMV